MADSGGHWLDLAEAQKLTQSTKIPGVFEEDIKRNNPVDRMQVAQASGTGTKIEWLRELTTTEDAVNDVGVGGLLNWQSDLTYTEKEMTLKICYIQRKLDKYVQGIYGTYNNYETQVMLECEKGLKRKLGARIIYADTSYTSALQPDGLHALAAEHGTPYTAGSAYDAKNIDGGTVGLSLMLLRTLMDSVLAGVDELWAPFEIIRWLDAAYQEKGFAGLATATAGNLGFLSMGFNELGKRVLYWDGAPIIRTDYLVAEQDGTGTGGTTNARALYTSGTKCYSIFAIKHGNVMKRQPGVTFAYGGTQGQGDLYKLDRFATLENYDAQGFRLITYWALLLGSSQGLGRIFDITNVAVTV